MTISHIRRAGVTVLLAGAALLLAPVPAHAETVCMTAPNGAPYCFDNGQGGGGIGGSNTGSAGGAPVSGGYGSVPPPPPSPIGAIPQQPAPGPAPYQAPAPVYAPAPVTPEATTAPAATVAAAPAATATTSPTASATPGLVTAATAPASSTAAFNPVPLLFIIGGVMLAAALAWFVRPVRAALARIVPRRRP